MASANLEEDVGRLLVVVREHFDEAAGEDLLVGHVRVEREVQVLEESALLERDALHVGGLLGGGVAGDRLEQQAGALHDDEGRVEEELEKQAMQVRHLTQHRVVDLARRRLLVTPEQVEVDQVHHALYHQVPGLRLQPGLEADDQRSEQLRVGHDDPFVLHDRGLDLCVQDLRTLRPLRSRQQVMVWGGRQAAETERRKIAEQP